MRIFAECSNFEPLGLQLCSQCVRSVRRGLQLESNFGNGRLETVGFDDLMSDGNSDGNAAYSVMVEAEVIGRPARGYGGRAVQKVRGFRIPESHASRYSAAPLFIGKGCQFQQLCF